MTEDRDRKRRKVVFVTGVGHCGSTLLDLLLGSHSQGFSLGEWRSLHRAFAPGSSGRVSCGVCGEDCEFWNQEDRLSVLRRYFAGAGSRNWFSRRAYWFLANYKLSIYREFFAWTGAIVLVDSGKSISWIARQHRPAVRWRAVDPYLVFIHRDGRAVVNSYLRKYKQSRTTEDVVNFWVAETRRIEDYYAHYDPERRFALAYEDLATSPADIMQSVCAWLDIDFEPGMLDFWEHGHHIIGGNYGVRSQLVSGAKRVRNKPQNESVHAQPAHSQHPAFTPSIRLDLRWKSELGQERLATFEKIAGSANEPYAHDD